MVPQNCSVSHILQNIFLLCSAEQRHSYRFGNTWGWVNDDRIFIFGWTIPLNREIKVKVGASRAGPINDIISNRDKIYVDNDDKLWTLLLDMDWSKSQSHRRNMRQQPISVQRARQNTKSACTSKYKVNFLPHLAKQARHKNDKKMSGTSNESETNLELLSKDDEIVDKKGSTNSVIWKWFGYLKSDEAQIKTICKICRRFVKTKTGNTTNLFHHLKKYHPNDHTESMKMRADATPSTSRASIGAVPKQKSIVSSFVAIRCFHRCTHTHIRDRAQTARELLLVK